MDTNAVMALAEKIEKEPLYDSALCQLAFDQVEVGLPKLDRTMIRNGALGNLDAVLLVIDHGLPGWSIAMNGTASEEHGNWTCTLRRQISRDDDSAVGVGKGPKLSNVLIAALLKALARLSPITT